MSEFKFFKVFKVVQYKQSLTQNIFWGGGGDLNTFLKCSLLTESWAWQLTQSLRDPEPSKRRLITTPPPTPVQASVQYQH